MTKRQLIDEIVSINQTAEPSFLAQFDDVELDSYLRHLQVIRTPRLSGDARRYDRYFKNCPNVAARPVKADATLCPPTEDPGHEDSQEESPLFADQAPPTEDQADLSGVLDLRVSKNAYFRPSYEAKVAQ